MKKFGILFMLLISLTVSAQSDFDIAKEFMSKKGVKLAPNERSTTRGTDVPYSIFNGSEGKGFAIVVNGKVVGYDTENTANTDDLPIQLKEMLEAYSKISSKGMTRGTGTDYPDWYTPKDVTPIEPIITTHWHQGYPFNEYCLADDVKYKEDGTRDSTRVYAGCTSIALAQLMTLYKPEGSTKIPGGSQVVVATQNPKLKRGDVITTDSLPPTTFDWEKIELKESYNTIKLSKDSLDAIAKLILYCARACHVAFSNYGSVGGTPGEGTLKYFGFNEDDVLSAHTNEEISSDSFDYYLERGCPIIGGKSNHCLLLDGRNEIGMYHLNFGWGGNSDGYYAIYNKNIYDNIKESHKWMTPYLRDDFDCTVITSKVNITNIITNNIIGNNNSNNRVYNLQGVKVGNSLEGLPRGVYIQGGKKIVK